MNRAIDPEPRRDRDVAAAPSQRARRPRCLSSSVSPTSSPSHRRPPTVPNRRRRAAGIGATIAVIAGGDRDLDRGVPGCQQPRRRGFARGGGAGVCRCPRTRGRARHDRCHGARRSHRAAHRRSRTPPSEVERVGILDESFSLDAVGGDRRRRPGADADDREPRHRPRSRHGHRRKPGRDVRSGVVPTRLDRPRRGGRRAGGQPAVASPVGQRPAA